MNPKRIVRAALIVSAPIALGALAWCVDPLSTAWLPKCPFHLLTGLHCPGCGSTRAMHQLVHGHIRAAFAYNALTVLLTPLMLWLLIRELFQTLGRRLKRPRVPHKYEWVLWAVIVVFGILRNLPIHPFTLLAPHQ